jgi:hypothetical protein
MHHPALLRCLSVLGLSACTNTPAQIDSAEPGKLQGPEPSGLGMREHAASPDDGDSGPRFVAEERQWCDVWIDARGRTLEPTPSFLQAWNLVAEGAQATMRYVAVPPLTEDDARTRICGNASCKIEQPQIFEATFGGSSAQQTRTMRAGFAVLIPSERGTLVVPVAGAQQGCSLAPELRTARSGSLVHLTALVHEGDYARYYFHGYEEHGYGNIGGCNRLSTSRTDIVIDLETAQLELVLTQASTPTRPDPQVDVRLGPQGIELHGCSGVLALEWTG